MSTVQAGSELRQLAENFRDWGKDEKGSVKTGNLVSCTGVTNETHIGGIKQPKV